MGCVYSKMEPKIKYISSDPPQGTYFCNENDKNVKFYVNVFFSEPIVNLNQFIIQIWFGIPGENWSELKLEFDNNNNNNKIIFNQNRDPFISYLFTGNLNVETFKGKPIEFIIRYKYKLENTWSWYNKLPNGRILFPNLLFSKKLLNDFFIKFGNFNVNKIKNNYHHKNDIKLWSIESKIIPNPDKYFSIFLGIPNSPEKYFALIRKDSYWITPLHSKNFIDINFNKQALLIAFLQKNGTTTIIIPISHFKFGISSFLTTNSKTGEIFLNIRNENLIESNQTTIIANGKDVFQTINVAMLVIRNIISNFNNTFISLDSKDLLSNQLLSPFKTKNDIHTKWFETWYDKLGFCTWNAFYTNISEQKIINILQNFHKNGIKIGFLIIDDGWQTVNNQRQWVEFEADPIKFPKGLKHTIKTIRKLFPYIHYIGVWHALHGYWNGIDPQGTIAKKYKTINLKSELIIHQDDVKQMYLDFYQFLDSCLINCTKVDVQAKIDNLTHGSNRTSGIVKAYQNALRLAGITYFYNRVILCMAHVPQYFFYDLNIAAPKPILRNSDDFFPEIDQSHPWHIFSNSMNSVFTSNLDIVPDWDMFQSTGTFSEIHAATRLLSGGPVYFADSPSSSNYNLLKSLTINTILNNETILLKPEGRSFATDCFQSFEEDRILKISNKVIVKFISLLGLFNLKNKLITESITSDLRKGFSLNSELVIRNRFGKVYCLEKNRKIPVFITLYPLEWDVLTVSELHHDTENDTYIGILGIDTTTGLGSAAIVSAEIGSLPKKWTSYKVTIRAIGKLVIYIKDFSSPGNFRDRLAIFLYQHILIPPESVTLNKNVLIIDLVDAWSKLNLGSKFSNEIEISISFRI